MRRTNWILISVSALVTATVAYPSGENTDWASAQSNDGVAIVSLRFADAARTPQDIEVSALGAPSVQGDSSPLARLASIRPSESEARALRMYREAAAAELYAHYAPLAEAGSAHAQYELSRLYLFCTISPTDETMALYEKDPRYDAKLEQYRKNHVRCAGFREVAGATDDLEQPMREWLRKASESGSPLARFELEVADCMNEVGPYARENAAAGSQSFSARRVPSQQLVYDVLTYARGHEDPRVRYLSVRQAMFYFVWFVENERYLGEFNFDRTAGHVKRPPLSEAWRLLGCASSANCSLEERLESIARNYYSYEIHEIVATTLDLHSAIWQGDWSRLGYPQAEGRAPISLLPAPRRFKAAP